jgi:hypothetical protein
LPLCTGSRRLLPGFFEGTTKIFAIKTKPWRVATPVLTANLLAVSQRKPVKAPEHEVMTMTDEQKKQLAEKYIKQSRLGEYHTCFDSYESPCDGCEFMRKGLSMLAELEDATVYRVG